MTKKNGIIAGLFVLILLPIVAVTVYFVGQQQDVRSRAATPTPTVTGTQSGSTQQLASCPAPAQVQNVTVVYPDNTVTPNSFTSAACTWDAVTGAASYTVKITQVETNTVVKNDTTTNTHYSFPVAQTNTYQCDVSAVAACGTAGPVGTGQALCQINGLVSSPTPTPLVQVTSGPTPTPGPSVCGYSCTTSAGCTSGLICAIATNGQGYCAQPNLQQACVASPSLSACCIPPATTTTPRPTIPPTGGTTDTVIAGVGVLSTIATGIFLLLKAGL